MILVTVGSQKFQFNRLLKKIDQLIIEKKIVEEVFAQIGSSDYVPKNYKYVDFLSQEEFNYKIDQCSLVITHAGTGVIINALKKGKKVIAIPRLCVYGEHVDDHQIQLINEFDELNFIEAVYDIDQLDEAIKRQKNKKYNKYSSNTDKIINSIKEFVDKI